MTSASVHIYHFFFPGPNSAVPNTGCLASSYLLVSREQRDTYIFWGNNDSMSELLVCVLLVLTAKNRIRGTKGKIFIVFPGHAFTCSATEAVACVLCSC